MIIARAASVRGGTDILCLGHGISEQVRALATRLKQEASVVSKRSVAGRCGWGGGAEVRSYSAAGWGGASYRTISPRSNPSRLQPGMMLVERGPRWGAGAA